MTTKYISGTNGPYYEWSHMVRIVRGRIVNGTFKRSVLPETSRLRYLLPDKRDSSVTNRLRHPRNFETLKSKTTNC